MQEEDKNTKESYRSEKKMNEKQTTLGQRSKQDELKSLYKKHFTHLHKVITYFGNVESRIMIYGIGPVKAHMVSTSKTAFKFDQSITQGTLSGGVLCKVFNFIDKSIPDYWWCNIYKIPVETVTKHNTHRQVVLHEIGIIKPLIIVCLGLDAYNEMLKISPGVEIYKIRHPGAVLYGLSHSEYTNEWQRFFKYAAKKLMEDKYG